MKIVVITDIHKRGDSPRSWKLDFNAQTTAQMVEIAEFCSEVDAEIVLLCGDLFDKLDPDSTPYRITSEFANELLYISNCGIRNSHKRRLVTAVGNHDARDLENIEKYPFYCLCKMVGIWFARESGLAYFDEQVEIVTVNHDRCDTSEKLWEIAKSNFSKCEPPRVEILLVHGPICPVEKRNLYPEALKDKLIPAEALRGIADFVFYGDLHDYHGIYKEGNTVFCNPGSLARNTSKELDRNRNLYVSLLDTATRELQLAELECTIPANLALKTQDILEERQQKLDVTNFVEQIRHTEFSVLTPDILKERIANSTELNDVEKTLALQEIDKIAAIQ